ncbi:hypothetical protein [Ornithobacterium rhinotracheale]|uniref:hypothetical protein n=1 Tax=Ornithobacterium rhinotracheale TaxID=28251 RepID=UPI0040363925
MKRVIKATANHSKRTFTLRDNFGAKYRTNRMSKEEFEMHLNNTSEDWLNYLSTEDDYYAVK